MYLGVEFLLPIIWQARFPKALEIWHPSMPCESHLSVNVHEVRSSWALDKNKISNRKHHVSISMRVGHRKIWIREIIHVENIMLATYRNFPLLQPYMCTIWTFQECMYTIDKAISEGHRSYCRGVEHILGAVTSVWGGLVATFPRASGIRHPINGVSMSLEGIVLSR